MKIFVIILILVLSVFAQLTVPTEKPIPKAQAEKIRDFLKPYARNGTYSGSSILVMHGNIISVGQERGAEGGAHPSSWTACYNYHVTRNREFTLKDVLVPNYHRRLAILLKGKVAELSRNGSHRFGNSEKESTETILKWPTNEFCVDEKDFLVLDEGIRFYYGYCHFYCAVGDFSVYVTYDELEKLLKNDRPTWWD